MNPEAKMQKLFGEVKEENKETFSKMEQYGKLLNDKYLNFVTRLDTYFRTKCPSQVKWLEANTVQTQQGPQLRDQSKKQEFEKTIDSFRKCVEVNDPGSEPLLRKFEEEAENIYRKFSEGVQGCTRSNTDSEIKSCFKNLVVDNANDTQRLFQTFDSQFDEFTKKL
jgi:hypothetical protein